MSLRIARKKKTENNRQPVVMAAAAIGRVVGRKTVASEAF